MDACTIGYLGGLHYNYFRTYDPTTGRYLESDPIGLGGGLNSYGYVGGNPTRFFDFFGLEEGSESNLSKRKALADWALEQNGSTDFGVDKNYSPQYPADSYKCSGFTCAAAAAADAATTVTVPDGEGTLDRCPTAIELAKCNVPNWRLLKPGESPEPGDIMADPRSSPVPGVTGHAAVIVGDGSKGTTTVGAHYDRVGPLGHDYPSNPEYRRYTGN